MGYNEPMADNAAWLEAHLLRTVRSESLIEPGQTVLVAVSGGVDSMALLLLLSAVRRQIPCRVVAAHYEHGIRGEASLEDAAFVEAFCEARGIACHIGHGDVRAMRSLWRTSLEDAARRARYAFLRETAERVGAARIALAHQQEDQAETLLLHLVHGAGLAGLSGMRVRRGPLIRPLLEVPRAALEAYLRERGIPWREDATNQDVAHARNLLRLRVFPELRRLNPRAVEAMARTARLAAMAEDALTAQASERLSGAVRWLPYGGFWQLVDGPPTAEAVRLFARSAGIPPLDARQTEAVVRLLPGGAENLPGGWRALRTKLRLHLIRPDPKPAEAPADAFHLADGTADDLGDGIRRQAFDADRIEGATMRTRLPGDRFSPLGMAGEQKLKQALIDAGIDRPFRDLVPLVAIGHRVLWIVGVKPGNDAAVSSATRRITMLTYHGPLPWELPAGGPHAEEGEEPNDD